MKSRFTELPLFFAASFVLLGSWHRPATAQLLGPEFLVNSHTTDSQAAPAVAADGEGNFVVVWRSQGQDGSDYGLFGQRWDAAGSPIGSEFLVNSYTTYQQLAPKVAMDGAGNFVVVWESWGQDSDTIGLFGQRFDSAGNKVGSELQVNAFTTDIQARPAVVTDGSGGFIVAWEGSGEGDAVGVFGQRFDSTGSPLGSELLINSYTEGDQGAPAVAADGAGNFVVTWQSQGQDGSDYGVFGQRFDAAGSPVGSEFSVNTYVTNEQRFSAVAMLGSGNFVVAWDSYLQDGSKHGVFAQRFDAAASPIGSEFRLDSYTTDDQRFPSVASDSAGNFLVTWQSEGPDGSSHGVFEQRFDSAGDPIGSEFQVNDYTTGTQRNPAVTADGSGNFVVAWQSDDQDGDSRGVFARQVRISVFADDFDLGDSCAWSASVGGDC